MGGGGPIMMVENPWLCWPICLRNRPWHFVWRLPLRSCGGSLGDEFHCHLVFVFDNCFHCFQYFVVKDVLFGTIPACYKRVINTWYALASLWLFLLLMGLTKIALLSILTMTIMYLLPHWDRVGNHPVWLENTVWRMSYTRVNTSRTFLPVSCDVLGS